MHSAAAALIKTYLITKAYSRKDEDEENEFANLGDEHDKKTSCPWGAPSSKKIMFKYKQTNFDCIQLKIEKVNRKSQKTMKMRIRRKLVRSP